MPRGNGKRVYGSQALEKGLRVLDFLNTGDLLDWKGLKEVAAGAGVSVNEAHGALHTFIRWGWVEQGDKGFRASGQGLIRYALAAQEALVVHAERLGLR